MDRSHFIIFISLRHVFVIYTSFKALLVQQITFETPFKIWQFNY